MPPLPRSRFSERVAKSTVGSGDEMGHILSPTAPEASPISNPFDEDEKVGELKPKRIRRRKRRAPLPPNMTREEGDNTYLGVSSMHNFSKWSLTSVETDASTYSESDHLNLDVVNQEISEIMHNITKEMEKMTDDTNNNNNSSTKEICDEKPYSDIPDLIASSTEGVVIQNASNKSTENVSEIAALEHESENPIDENSNLVPKIKCENVEEEFKNSSTKHNKNECATQESECDSNKSNCEESEILFNATYTHASSVQDLTFYERKSIFITASNDQLDKPDSLTGIVSDTLEDTENVDINQNKNDNPPLSPRCKTEVNVILNNISQFEEENPQNEEENSAESVCQPIPKTRTHRPSKDDLLGNHTAENL